MANTVVTIDGNEAAAHVAHRMSEVIAIYPITPSTPMGELSDAWSAVGKTNLWGTVPNVIEMQSEGGAAGAVHGALQGGALSTTFTASQGLLLMIPNMYKIAGELTPTVFHVAARSLAAQGLSIFGDHSDVMSVRATGFAMLASNSVQEAHDMAVIAHAATLESRVPFIHFFDGFRISHEISKIHLLDDDTLRAMLDMNAIQAHRSRALTPDRPIIRGTAQNPDVYFQARETVNPYYTECATIVQRLMDDFAAHTGRQYHIFDYEGAPDAEHVIVIMGSGADTVRETVAALNAQGAKVGVLIVRLFRPFVATAFVAALPATVRRIAVLDRTKEPGSGGEPLYKDVLTALSESLADGEAPFDQMPRVIGGRYGLSSKDFTPAMVKGVFEELTRTKPRNHFTIGINDDVMHTSLPFDPTYSIEHADTVRCVFWGLGSDGTVGANKNSIKIIGEETDNYAQGYFVYDSKKAGASTISHLRFGPTPFQAHYLISEAQFVACHQFSFLERLDVLKYAAPNAVFLLNSIYGPDEVWAHLPREVQETIIERQLQLYVIDAYAVAGDAGMGGRINTVMQTCFFAISGVLPREQAIEQIKQAIRKTYGNRGETVVQRNFAAVDAALAHLHRVEVPATVTSDFTRRPPVPAAAPAFVHEVLAPMMTGDGDALPVSKLPIDGTFPTATTQWEKRNLSLEIPVWEPDLCIQCGKCAYVCPHAVIRMKVCEPTDLDGAPEAFKHTDARFKEFPGAAFTLQVSPEDCTGCTLCVEVCPAKDKSRAGRKAINMAPQPPIREQESANWEFFLQIPEVDRTRMSFGSIKNSQLLQPLFEFSGACAGCGETPYLKLLSQLYGDRALIANATGCSSIYGGNLPTTPWATNNEGRGPAWSNSLFEDNAEFGLGMRMALDKQMEYARELLLAVTDVVGVDLVTELRDAPQHAEAEINAQRKRVAELKERLVNADSPQARDLLALADSLVRKSVWIVGGDGWAYDMGYGGLDHVLASGHNVNVLVLDTQVYSNTGGQASKATPLGAVAKFAAQGKTNSRKQLGLLAMTYGNIYVAQVAMGSSDIQTLRAFQEAEAYDGPSLIIAYSHCIAHGINMQKGLEQQKLLVDSGMWQLFRYNPTHYAQHKNPLTLDSKAPRIPVAQYIYNEARYRMLQQSDPDNAAHLLHGLEQVVQEQWNTYQQLHALYEPAAPETQEEHA